MEVSALGVRRDRFFGCSWPQTFRAIAPVWRSRITHNSSRLRLNGRVSLTGITEPILQQIAYGNTAESVPPGGRARN